MVVTHQESGTFRETVTAADGTFFITGIVPGPYQVAATLEGFRKLTRDVRLEVGATVTLDLSLEVGALTETVTVTTEAPLVDITSTQVGGNVSLSEITDLPSLTRNFTGLIALLPGVVYNAAGDGNSDSVTINGQHGSGVVFMMDGGSNNDDLRGGSSGAQARTPLEAIQEFQVVTNQFDAEYGAAVAGVVNAVTKQGTNAFRGSAFGYFTDKTLTAEDFFVEQQNLEKPDTKKQQWGGTIGGPIVRDKMHFFFSFERQNRIEGRSRNYATRPDRSFTAPQQSNYWNYLGRVDHQLNSRHNYSVRYLLDHQPSINQVLAGGGSTGNLPGTIDTLSIERDNDWSLVGSYNWVASSTKLNTLRASFVYEKPKRGQPLYQETGDWTQASPTLQFVNFIDQADDNYADFRIMKAYALDETFSWFVPGARGTHELKLGSQYQYGEHYREDQRVTNGRFIFPSDRAYNAADPSTYPERLNVRVPQMVQAVSKTHSLGLFMRDKWQMTPQSHAQPRPALRPPRVSDPELLEPVLRRPERVSRGLEQHSASRGIRLRHGGRERRHSRRLRDVLREAVRRPLRELPAEPPVLQLLHCAVPRQRCRSGPGGRAVPDRPAPRERSRAEPRPGRPAVSSRNAGQEHRHRVARYARSHPSAAASRLDRLRAPARGAAVVCRRLRPHVEPQHAAALQPEPRHQGRTPAARRRSCAPISRASPPSWDCRRSGGDVFIVEYIGQTEYDGLNLQLEKRFSSSWAARVSYGLGTAGAIPASAPHQRRPTISRCWKSATWIRTRGRRTWTAATRSRSAADSSRRGSGASPSARWRDS